MDQRIPIPSQIINGQNKRKHVSFYICWHQNYNGFSIQLVLLHVIIFVMAIQAFHGSACCFHSQFLHFSSSTTASSLFLASKRSQSCPSTRKSLKLKCSSSGNNGDQVSFCVNGVSQLCFLKLCLKLFVGSSAGLSSGCSSFCRRWILFQWRQFFQKWVDHGPWMCGKQAHMTCIIGINFL